MTRRRLLLALALAPIAGRLAAAPPQKVLRLGIPLGFDAFDPVNVPVHRALIEGLRMHGYEPGRNYTIEAPNAPGNVERLPSLAAEMVRAKVDIIIALNAAATLAAYEATKTIPIVMVGTPDPVVTGVVKSLSRPGTNVTGLALNAAEASGKRVQLLKEAVPSLSRVAVLWNSSLVAMSMGFHETEVAAPRLGVSVESIRVSGSGDLDSAFEAISRNRCQALVVLFGPMRGDDLPRIVKFVTAQRIPAVFEVGRGGAAGGLMEFGADLVGMARQAAGYVDRIANGARPADLPVEEPLIFELNINLKAARAMGLEIPASLVMRASRIIE